MNQKIKEKWEAVKRGETAPINLVELDYLEVFFNTGDPTEDSNLFWDKCHTCLNEDDSVLETHNLYLKGKPDVSDSSGDQ